MKWGVKEKILFAIIYLVLVISFYGWIFINLFKAFSR